MKKRIDWVSIAISIIAIVSLKLPGFIYFKKMRIQNSESLFANTALNHFYYVILGMTIVVLVMNIIKQDNKILNYILGIIAGLSIVLMLYFISNALEYIPFEKTEYSRLSIGPSMWLWMISMIGIIIKVSEKLINEYIKNTLYIIPMIIILILILLGELDGLAIMMEYQTKKVEFIRELITHIKLSVLIVIISILTGVPLGYLVNKNKIAEKIVFSIINITETIPGISFIAMLMIPLSYISNKYSFLVSLGITGFGVAPAFIALFLYALFPIIHSTRAAFRTIDQQYIEVAQAMGMLSRRIFYKIELPLALPIILSGIRLATVYTVTGVTLAAFIGGGGLGIFMIQTESMDLILLGTIPIIMITYMTDTIFKKIIKVISIKG